MNSEVFINIKKNVLEIIESLKTSLKDKIEKEWLRHLGISHSFSDSENIQALTLCLYKAKGYKKIELDFPDTLFAASHRELILKFEAIRLALAKRYAIILGSPNKIGKEEIILPYENIKLFFRDVFNKFRVSNIIVEKILDFLVICLQKEETSNGFYKTNETLKYFFDFISLIIDRENGVQRDFYIEKLDILEKLDFFSKVADEVQRSFYDLIYEIDGFVIYKNLLVKISLLTESAFRDDLILKEFIRIFVNQFNAAICMRETDFESVLILLYLVLENKARFSVIETHGTWINSFGLSIRGLVGKAEISHALAQFKIEYEKKVGNKFEIKLEQFKNINPDREIMMFRDKDIKPVITRWFCLENINRTSMKVKSAFSIALEKTAHLTSNPSENSKKIKNDMIELLERGVGTLKSLVVEGKEQLANTASQAHTYLNNHKIIRDLNVLQKRLNELKESLRNFIEFIERFLGPVNAYSSRQRTDLKKPLCPEFSANISAERYLDIEKTVKKLEEKIINFIRDNQFASLINQLLNKVKTIKDENSWFENKFLKKRIIESIFKRGYFFKKQVKLTKLKTQCIGPLSYEFEKNFFLTAGFFTLLRYGIIRWFWVDKEAFAKKWAEQIVFLKVADKIKEGEYGKNYEESNNSIRVFQSLAELYKQMTVTKIENNPIRYLFSDLIQGSERFISEIDDISIKIADYILVGQKKYGLSLAFKVKSDREDVLEEPNSSTAFQP